MGAELVVGVFDEEGDAWDAVVAAAEVAAQRRSGILDACLVVRRQDGTVHIRETRDISPSAAGWSGAASGLLGGVILGFPFLSAWALRHGSGRAPACLNDDSGRSIGLVLVTPRGAPGDDDGSMGRVPGTSPSSASSAETGAASPADGGTSTGS